MESVDIQMHALQVKEILQENRRQILGKMDYAWSKLPLQIGIRNGRGPNSRRGRSMVMMV